jgi:hypothetical protein
MYGLYNIQDGYRCDTAGLNHWLTDSVLIEQWSVPVWHGDILIRLKQRHGKRERGVMMHVLKLHQCATEPLNYMILLHMKFLDQVVTRS